MSSIKDVAKAANVSTATVSRVLAKHPHVRPALRERVLAAVAQLEYRPNLIARNLRSQQSKTLGLIVSDIRNPFFTAVSRAVEDTAYAHGYNLLLCNTDENPEKELLYLQLMGAEQVAGVIFSPTLQTLNRWHELHLSFPTVLIDRSLRSGDVDAVLLDNLSAGSLLAQHLLSQGYRRIGAIFGEASTTGRERQRGFEAALHDAGLSIQPEYVRFVRPQSEAGYHTTLELLGLPEPPQVIFTSNSLLTAGALQAIREQGLHIPAQIGLVGFDDTAWASLVQPAITVLAQPTDEIGRSATELLLQRVADPQRPTRKIILQGELIVRESSVEQRGRT
ncbi:LacI family DNA-binding transcriptional regulator [Herpetosiphon geysericola]|uniref:LacI family transcriptional regulator n=1 Tax=Herpetosiphon geysericola TaxID=70996 RepID=A0A0P6YKF3_9CHLR|nr:LacI family DNA-binding transcriptional regulator [Herpetosiphon geysericola]KPL85679.1 LacI family transcriptional regulator [Herpetosiphon geysericola]